MKAAYGRPESNINKSITNNMGLFLAKGSTPCTCIH